MKSINDIKLYNLPHIEEENGDLTIIEQKDSIPFSIKRVFVVRAKNGAIRGYHSHYKCSQLLVCTHGFIKVVCDDSQNKKIFELNRPGLGLFIPPGIWAYQKYFGSLAVLTVLCDHEFDEEDYIRNYDKYLSYRHQEKQN